MEMLYVRIKNTQVLIAIFQGTGKIIATNQGGRGYQ